MLGTSRVSACIVGFNSGIALQDCVKSLLASGVVDEVFVVDNASTDDSLKSLDSIAIDEPTLRVIRNDRNAGFAAASNIGMLEAHGDLLLLLNPDCLVNEAALKALARALEENPGAGMAGPLIKNPDGSEQRGCRRDLPRLGNSLRRVLAGRSRAAAGFDHTGSALPDRPQIVEAISGACMLVRRTALDTVGLMDEGYFLHCEDLDWCRRFGDAGWKILFVPDAIIEHVQGVSSSSRPVRVLWYKHRSMWRYFRKFDAASTAWPLVASIWLGIHLRALMLTPLVALRWLRP